MISIRNLHVRFNPGSALEKHALQGIDLDLGANEFVSVIGSNGAGKSTLLNSLVGSIEVNDGQIQVDDQNITVWPIWKRAPLIGLVGQDPRLGSYEDLTIAENMAIASLRGSSRGLKIALTNSHRARFAEALEILGLGLENRMDTSVGLLSGGQRQALSLIMTTLRPMRILLLDEHTAALDPRMAEMVSEITEHIVHSHGLTALMVTHSMQQALKHGSRTIMLHDGKILLDVSGNDKSSLSVEALLAKFSEAAKQSVAEDRMLLG